MLKTNVILSITALQGEDGSIKLELSTMSRTEVTAARTETAASQMMLTAFHGENIAISADNTPVSCVT